MTRISNNGCTNHERLSDIDFVQRGRITERVEQNLKIILDAMENTKPKPCKDPRTLIAEECDKIKEMLLDKNRKYGNSAIAPKRIFSSADPIEQINVRIDDKLSRIAAGQTDDTEDAESDLIGYLILKKVAIANQNLPPGNGL